MSNKISLNKYVSNPIDQKQIVNLNVEADCSPDLECGTLNQYLEDIYSKLCVVPNYTLDCLTITGEQTTEKSITSCNR